MVNVKVIGKKDAVKIKLLTKCLLNTPKLRLGGNKLKGVQELEFSLSS